MNNHKEKSGFEDDPESMKLPCRHPSHNPPMALYISPGKIYKHVCPECGHVTVMRPSTATLKDITFT